MASEAVSNGSHETSTLPTLPSSTAPITTSHLINIGTRKSNLALVQTDLVIALLKQKWPQHEYKVHAMSTMGDKNQVTALHDFGAKSLWTFELEDMLLSGQVDFIVHCLKDMPTQLPPKCTLGPILERADPRDAFILSRRFFEGNGPIPTLATLPKGSVIGTSSVRRTAQLKRLYPHLAFASVRGNVETRLRKLDAEDSQYSALILAAAGLIRIQRGERISGFLESKNVEGEVKPSAETEGHDDGRGAEDVEKRQGKIGDEKWGMLYAVGQGALAFEIREGDDRVRELLEPLRSQRSTLSCLAERSLMRTLEGGCSVPIGVETEWKGEESWELTMRAIVVSLDGAEAAEAEVTKTLEKEEDSVAFGIEVARLLEERGADRILAGINSNREPMPPGTDARFSTLDSAQ